MLETVYINLWCFFQNSLINKTLQIFCNNIKVFTITFDKYIDE